MAFAPWREEEVFVLEMPLFISLFFFFFFSFTIPYIIVSDYHIEVFVIVLIVSILV
jgi:hypothetical protein